MLQQSIFSLDLINQSQGNSDAQAVTTAGEQSNCDCQSGLSV